MHIVSTYLWLTGTSYMMSLLLPNILPIWMLRKEQTNVKELLYILDITYLIWLYEVLKELMRWKFLSSYVIGPYVVGYVVQ